MVVADELLLKIRADSSQAQAAMVGLDRTVDKTTSNMGAKFKKAGLAVAASMAIVGGAVLTGGAKSFIGFDAAMTQSLAIMGDVSDAMRNDMSKAAREVAKTTTFSAEQAAESYFFLASAGLSAEQSIAAMPQVAAFAQAGMFDMAKATDLATDAQSALGLTVEDSEQNLENLTRVTDVFVKANSLANTSVEQIAEAMTTKAGTAARTLGMDIEETSAILLVMADAGIKGSAAGTQLGMMLNNLSTNAVKNADAFEEFGIAVFDSDGEIRNMADIVEDMTVSFGDMSDAQKVAAISQLGFGDRAAATLKVLLGQEDALRGYEDALNGATGETMTVAEKQLQTFSAQWDIFKSKIVDVGISIGSVVVPKMVELLESITPVVDKIVEWVAENPELATQITAIATAVGALMTALLTGHPVLAAIALVIGGVKLGLDHLGLSFGDILEIGKNIWKFFENLGTSTARAEVFLGKLPEPIQGFISAIGDLVLQGKEMWEKIMGTFTGGGDSIMETIDTIKTFITDAWDAIWKVVGPLVDDIFGFIIEEAKEVVDWFGEIWPDIHKIIKTVLELVQRAWERIWPIIAKFIMPIWETIKSIISGVMNVIKGIIQTVLALITGNWEGAWNGILKIGQGIWEIISGAVENFILMIQLAIEGALAVIQTVWDTVWTFMKLKVQGVWEGISGFVRDGMNNVLGFISSLVNGVIDAINTLIRAYNKLPFDDIKEMSHIALSVGGGTASRSGGGGGATRLADGGMPVGRGVVRAMVGERGPEEVMLPAGSQVTPGGSGPLIGQLITQGSSGREIAEEIGWEMLKRGGGS